VAAEGFLGATLLATDVWVPLTTISTRTSYLAERSLGWALLRGRLKAGVSMSQAAAELDAIGRALQQEHPDHNRGRGLRLAAASFIPGNLALPLAGVMTLILGFVSLVLVIACTNLANLLLVRAVTRRREIAVRVSIGAGRARIVRQLLTETLMLFGLAGAVGLLLANALRSLVVSLLPVLPVPLQVSLALDGRAIAFATGLSFVAALLCGVAPAFQASRVDVISTLKDEGAAISSRSRLRNLFVVSQVSLTIVLVAGAGVFASALRKATAIDYGFDPSGVELASLDLSLGGYVPATGQPFLRELASRIRAIPGVLDAAIAASPPVGGPARFGLFTHPGMPSSRGGSLPVDSNIVQPRYFSTLRIPLVAGRDFTEADGSGAPSVIIVSEEAARRFWPAEDPIGKTLLHHRSVFRRGEDPAPTTVVVIGVVRDVKSRVGQSPRAHVYLPLQQQFVPHVTVLARAAAGQRVAGQRVAGELRHVVSSMNPNLPVLSAQTLEDAAALTRLPQRIAALVSGSLGLVGLLLATMGIYGVTASAVGHRTREIGIRFALGASRSAVIAMLLRIGMTLLAAGAVIGVALTTAAGLVLRHVFADFPSLDALALVGAAALFMLIGATACYVPVRRASNADPAVVLRYE
jgi:predicted permease